MSSKTQITLWVKGLKCYEAADMEGAIKVFQQISPSSKIMFNIGCIMMRLGRLDQAIAALTKALEFDQFFSLGYFVRGTCLYALDILDEALSDANDSIRYLRGNSYIDYTQLGLKYKLYCSIAYFNRGIYLSKIGQDEEATLTLKEAARMAETTEDVDLRPVSQVLRTPRGAYHEQLQYYTFPEDLLFTPPVETLLNAKPKQHIPKAKVIAVENADDTYAGFSGREKSLTSLTVPSRQDPRVNSSENLRPLSGGSKPLNLPIKPPSSSAQLKPRAFQSSQNFPLKPMQAGSSSFSSNRSRDIHNKGTDADAIDDIISDMVDKTGDQGTASSGDILSNSPKPSVQKRIIKVKVHSGEETQVFATKQNKSFEDFKQKVKNKIKTDDSLTLQYKDEDGDMINICDEDDYNLALQSALAGSSNSTNPKIELWCR